MHNYLQLTQSLKLSPENFSLMASTLPPNHRQPLKIIPELKSVLLTIAYTRIPGALDVTVMLDLKPRVGLRKDLKFYISNKFPGDSDVTVWEPCFKHHTNRKPWQTQGIYQKTLNQMRAHELIVQQCQGRIKDMGLREGGTQVTQQGHSDVYLGKLRESVIAALLIF